MTKIWDAASNEYNWALRSPFSGVSEKLKDLNDLELQKKAQQAAKSGGNDEEGVSKRDVLLLEEWQELLAWVDPHTIRSWNCF